MDGVMCCSGFQFYMETLMEIKELILLPIDFMNTGVLSCPSGQRFVLEPDLSIFNVIFLISYFFCSNLSLIQIH